MTWLKTWDTTFVVLDDCLGSKTFLRGAYKQQNNEGMFSFLGKGKALREAQPWQLSSALLRELLVSCRTAQADTYYLLV